MSKILFGISLDDKYDYPHKVTGSIKYLSKDYIIIDMNNEGEDFKIQREKINQIKLLRKNNGKDRYSK